MLEKTYKHFNEDIYSADKYRQVVDNIVAFNGTPWRHMCEAPVFISRAFADEVVRGSEEIIRQSMAPALRETLNEAVPPEFRTPSAPDHPSFFITDFAVARGPDGKAQPQLIELQGFSSGLGFFFHAAQAYKEVYGLGDNYKYLVSPKTDAEYISFLKKTLLNGHPAENVVLMEIHPCQQKSKPDFIAIQKLVGLPIIDIVDVIKKGRHLFYKNAAGQEILIKRVYSRVVTGEFQVLQMAEKIKFRFTQDLDVEWAGDPAWFMRISKFTMPYLHHSMVPETKFLDQISEYPADLENYVLKPVFFNGGVDIKIDITKADLDAIPADRRHEYILMRKVEFMPFIPDLKGNKMNAEIRIMHLWADKLEPVMFSARVMPGNDTNQKLPPDTPWTGMAPVLIVDQE
jgi:hypothetical protein